MVNLIGKPIAAIASVVEPHVDRPFRARQVASWVVHRDARCFDEMTDLPKELRAELAARFSLADPVVVRKDLSRDGSAKYLFELEDGTLVEGVQMLDGRKATLCLSSQAGCAVGCTFCVTGALGTGRNLSAAEIVGQYRVMAREVAGDVDRVNVVFMGMGEPLLNRDQVGAALDALVERISPRRVTVSTAGIVPGIRWLGERSRRPKLALSLNAPDQERRVRIMPIAARYPLDELMTEVRRFPLERGRRVTFEYVVIAGFNDDTADARAVSRLIREIPSKVNVIPLNEDAVHFPDLKRPSEEVVDRFAGALRDSGLTVTVRWSKGLDVAAACGQLKGRALSPRHTGQPSPPVGRQAPSGS